MYRDHDNNGRRKIVNSRILKNKNKRRLFDIAYFVLFSLSIFLYADYNWTDPKNLVFAHLMTIMAIKILAADNIKKAGKFQFLRHCLENIPSRNKICQV